MKKAIIISLIIVSAVSYQYGKQNTDLPKTDSIQKSDIFECPYIVKSGSYKEHVRSNNEVKVLGKPEFISDPELIYMKEPFNEIEFEKGLYQWSSNKAW